ncbi:unnamed protein product, partial [marine sediment metagenome]
PMVKAIKPAAKANKKRSVFFFKTFIEVLRTIPIMPKNEIKPRRPVSPKALK